MTRRSLSLIICTLLIFVVGVLMVFNTSAAEILDRSLNVNLHQAVVRQIIYGILGVGVAFVVCRIGLDTLLRTSFPVLCALTFLLLLVFVPGIGQARNGSHRWIGVLGQTMQPSEFAKIWIPLFMIRWLLKEEVTLRRFIQGVGVVSVPMLLIMLEPDNGTTGIIGLSLMALCFLMQIRWRYWLLPMLVLAAVGGIAAWQVPYVQKRIAVYLNPELDLLGKGHQPYQAKIAAGSGGPFGRGLGQSMQKLTYLPEAQNDYIAAIYAEETGFLGMMGLLMAYATLASLGFAIAANAATKEGYYVASVMTFLLALQAFLNLGVVSGLIPSTGLNLPFFSQGGSSLIANSICIALLLNVGWKREATCSASA